MRILLASNSPYYPSFGGGNKSNRLLMEALAARGHKVFVVSRMRDFGELPHQALQYELTQLGHQPLVGSRDVTITLGGVEVRTLAADSGIRDYFAQQLQAIDPDVILTSTDDTAHLMYNVAMRAPRARVVYLIRATVALPFGPDSPLPSAALTQALRQADGVLTVSEYVAKYARQFGMLEARHIPISLLEPGEWPLLGDFENQFVTMVNPCAVKGLSIFLALADKFAHCQFAAVPTWGTTNADLDELRARPNITLLPPAEEMDQIYQQTRVILVPSLWAEARSRVILEAMSRGIPVMAANVGGLAEATLGAGYLLPVNPVSGYEPAVDSLMVPVAKIPRQDIAPWSAALSALLADRNHYESVAHHGRVAALAYKEQLHAGHVEDYLHSLLSTPRRERTVSRPDLSTGRQRLLALRMKQKSQSETGNAK